MPDVSRPNPDRDFRAVSWVRLMALLLEDCATATSLVTVATAASVDAIWLRKDKRTPNYLSLGWLYSYELGIYVSLHHYRTLACRAETNVRQTYPFFGLRYGYKLGY